MSGGNAFLIYSALLLIALQLFCLNNCTAPDVNRSLQRIGDRCGR